MEHVTKNDHFDYQNLKYEIKCWTAGKMFVLRLQILNTALMSHSKKCELVRER